KEAAARAPGRHSWQRQRSHTHRRLCAMLESDDIRAPASITLAALHEDPRAGLQVARELGCRGIHVSAAAAGTRPGDLDDSARRDLMAAARRHELEIVGIDAWARVEDLLDPSRVDAAIAATMAAINLAADMGRVPVSIRLPESGDPVAEEAVKAIAAAGDRLGVPVLDHSAPIVERPVGMQVGIDPPTWYAAGLDPMDGLSEGSGRLGSIRLADLSPEGMRVPPGGSEGRLDLVAFILTARVMGFEGLALIDARNWAGPRADLFAAIQRTLVGVAQTS
ncbi:MAG: hypothetical protein MK085_10580, partial [Phycisphaerales bacterium]|nr:hypothetical protein [Phycisphaerales bacterium]